MLIFFRQEKKKYYTIKYNRIDNKYSIVIKYKKMRGENMTKRRSLLCFLTTLFAVICFAFFGFLNQKTVVANADASEVFSVKASSVLIVEEDGLAIRFLTVLDEDSYEQNQDKLGSFATILIDKDSLGENELLCDNENAKNLLVDKEVIDFEIDEITYKAIISYYLELSAEELTEELCVRSYFIDGENAVYSDALSLTPALVSKVLMSGEANEDLLKVLANYRPGVNVTFVNGDDQDVETVLYGDSVAARVSDDPAVYIAWFDEEGNVFDFDAELFEDVTLTVESYDIPYVAGDENMSVTTSFDKVYGEEEFSVLLKPNAWASSFGFNSQMEIPQGVSQVTFYIYPETTLTDVTISTSKKTDDKIGNTLVPNTWNKFQLSIRKFEEYVTNGTIFWITNGSNVGGVKFYFSALTFDKYMIKMNDFSTLESSTDYVYGDQTSSTLIIPKSWAISFNFTSNAAISETATNVEFYIYIDGNKSNLALSTTKNYVDGRITYLTCNAWTKVQLSVADFNKYSDASTPLYITNGDNVGGLKIYFSEPTFFACALLPKDASTIERSDVKTYGDETSATLINTKSWCFSFIFTDALDVPEGSNFVEFYIYVDGNKSNIALSSTKKYTDGRITYLTCNDWTKVQLPISDYYKYSNADTPLYITNGDNVANIKLYFSEIQFVNYPLSLMDTSKIERSTDFVYGEEAYSVKVKPVGWKLVFKFADNQVIPEGAQSVKFYIYVDGSISNLTISTSGSANDRIFSLNAGQWNEISMSIEDYNNYVSAQTQLNFTNGDNVSKITLYISAFQFIVA